MQEVLYEFVFGHQFHGYGQSASDVATILVASYLGGFP